MRAIVYSGVVFEGHHPGDDHPEHPDRWKVLHEHLEQASGLVIRMPEAATTDQLLSVHTPAHVDLLIRTDAAGGAVLDDDTTMAPGSLTAALAAAGSALAGLTDAVGGQPVFVAARPPGHHASADRAMGFCLTNHVALAARGALELGARRVAILDWDVHHGNGTESLVEDWPEVSYLSLHEEGQFPGTGPSGERMGGRIRNLALPARTGHATYLEIFERWVVPWLRRQTPDLVLLSAGFDAHHADPLGHLSLETRTFHDLAKMLAHTTVDLLGKPAILGVLEGGYAPEATARSVLATLAGLTGQRKELTEAPPPRVVLSDERWQRRRREFELIFAESGFTVAPEYAAERLPEGDGPPGDPAPLPPDPATT
ncbi:MAG: histone deacetylase [Candidatus Sericytochromatia bacterium]|nr:histone deacetylase [Candidatus Sericytochromatia bacterium]